VRVLLLWVDPLDAVGNLRVNIAGTFLCLSSAAACIVKRPTIRVSVRVKTVKY
jgi:hypothetical protein